MNFHRGEAEFWTDSRSDARRATLPESSNPQHIILTNAFFWGETGIALGPGLPPYPSEFCGENCVSPEGGPRAVFVTAVCGFFFGRTSRSRSTPQLMSACYRGCGAESVPPAKSGATVARNNLVLIWYSSFIVRCRDFPCCSLLLYAFGQLPVNEL